MGLSIDGSPAPVQPDPAETKEIAAAALVPRPFAPRPLAPSDLNLEEMVPRFEATRKPPNMPTPPVVLRYGEDFRKAREKGAES